MFTKWYNLAFSLKCRLKPGCNLGPILFKVFISDLTQSWGDRGWGGGGLKSSCPGGGMYSTVHPYEKLNNF